MWTAIAAIFKFLADLMQVQAIKNWLQRDKAGEVIKRTAAMYDVMHNLVNVHSNYNIERFLILAAHNGGHNMQTFSPQFSSCRHEAIRPPIESVRNDYQGLPVDNEYIQMLVKVYVEKFVDIHTEDLKDGSLLKAIYQKEGVKHARVFFITQTKKEFIYGSVATTVDDRDIFQRPDVDVALRVSVAKLKQLMK